MLLLTQMLFFFFFGVLIEHRENCLAGKEEDKEYPLHLNKPRLLPYTHQRRSGDAGGRVGRVGGVGGGGNTGGKATNPYGFTVYALNSQQ